MATTKKPSRASGRAPLPVSAPKGASAADARIARLRELVTVLEDSTLNELSYEDEDLSVTLVRSARGGAGPAQPLMYAPAPAAPSPATASATSLPAKNDPDSVIVRSPFVGTFYRSPKPGLPSFTEIGEKVRRGQTLCIIEAMKLMNEIESEIDGTVVEVLAENNHAVQYGDPLFRLRKG